MTKAPSRIEKAAATRARVIDSARTLFLLQGYAATTTRQVASHARVTERTLFNIVASKSELLRQVLVSYVFTDDYGPLLERRDFAPVLRPASVTEFVAAYAKWVVNLHTHTAALAEMTRAAASVDAGAADIWRWGNAQQIVDLRNLAEVLNQRGWLRPGLDPEDLARSLAVLSGHESYWRLVTEQHWSRARYRRWLVRHCAAELISPERNRQGPEDRNPDPPGEGTIVS